VSKINFTLDLLATRPFPQIARVLRDRNDEIMSRWDATVRDVLPGADRLTTEQLRDSLPQIISQIVKALEAADPKSTLDLVEMTKPHGETRFHQHYSVKEVAAEYRMFRRILIEEVWDGVNERLTKEQVTALNMAVDAAFEGGLLAYVDHQRRQLREAGEFESKFLSFLSHDLRNHLNHAMLLLQTFEQRARQSPECDPDGSVAELAVVRKSILDTTAGMQRLLESERLRKWAGEMKRQKIDLGSFLCDMAAPFKREAEKKGITLQVQVPPGLTVISDPDLIRLGVQNLIGNAVKYSTKGTVRVTAGPRDDNGCTIGVSDDGPGIPPEMTGRLFEAFTRGETFGQPGVGLGLAIAAHAAKVLDGNLEVDSQVGVGSTFRLKVFDFPG
jgi:signal transduction histidine kinase